jgi:hypothetical protein
LHPLVKITMAALFGISLVDMSIIPPIFIIIAKHNQ